MGILKMIDRNLQLKPKPERWQDEPRHFNLIVCFEQRIFDIVVEDLYSRKPAQHRLAHVVNIETPDNFASAKIGGTLACQLVEMIAKSPDWEAEFPALLGIIEQTVQLQHAVVFY
ncbi:hypothetical protein BVRB_022200 [Beta vulgaris subsp. vulgaris]|uniref:RNA polymerase II subunit A C-terminal domain phosphatase SSU72 n=1 Tax=Beta vulgaris subsp. vulgaris TaxID=3555 RepID=A0A0J8B019_BETVV|nr:hypothetical protein BVRB_022200 [Beta vulgaris subsp. vulgaris]